MEPVFENELVYRFGFNQLEMTAIGCTRQSEANSKGRWGILTNNKDRVVTFGVGLTVISRSRGTSLQWRMKTCQGKSPAAASVR